MFCSDGQQRRRHPPRCPGSQACIHAVFGCSASRRPPDAIRRFWRRLQLRQLSLRPRPLRCAAQCHRRARADSMGLPSVCLCSACRCPRARYARRLRRCGPLPTVCRGTREAKGDRRGRAVEYKVGGGANRLRSLCGVCPDVEGLINRDEPGVA